MDAISRGVRAALRRLLRSSSFSLLAVIILAVGVAADSAIFSVVHGVLIRPLPHPDPEAAAARLDNPRFAALVHPPRDDVVGDVSGVLEVLLGSVGVILLIACANVANLFLALASVSLQASRSPG